MFSEQAPSVAGDSRAAEKSLRVRRPQLLKQQRLGHDHPMQFAQIEALVGGMHL